MVRRLILYKNIPDNDHLLSLYNRYERLKTAFIDMRDEDNLRLFSIKKAALQLQCNHISRSSRPAKRVPRTLLLSKLTGSDSICDGPRRFIPFEISQ
jgi:hypothetical protein